MTFTIYSHLPNTTSLLDEFDLAINTLIMQASILFTIDA